MRSMLRLRVLTVATAAVGLAGIGGAAPALAVSPGTSGQPNQTCLSSSAPREPGHAASARRSAFNEVNGKAGSVYAGSQPQNSKNPTSVSQYDVACFQLSQH